MQNRLLSDKLLYVGTAFILLGLFLPVLKVIVKLPYYWTKFIVGKFIPSWALSVNLLNIELTNFSYGSIFLIIGAVIFIAGIIRYKRKE